MSKGLKWPMLKENLVMDFGFFPPDFSSCKGLHAAGYLQAGVDRFRAPRQIGGRISGTISFFPGWVWFEHMIDF